MGNWIFRNFEGYSIQHLEEYGYKKFHFVLVSEIVLDNG